VIEKPTYRELEQKVKELEREIEAHGHREKEFVAKEGRNNYLLKEYK